MSTTILKLSDVIARTKLSRSSIYAYVAQGHFPQPVNLGPRSVGWIESDIHEWIRSRTKRRVNAA